MRRAYFFILVLVRMTAATCRPVNFPRLADTTSRADRSPWASSGLAGCPGQNTKRTDSAISFTNPGGGRYACVAASKTYRACTVL
jgi:hypothetical protein